jgi:hypothetical protein
METIAEFNDNHGFNVKLTNEKIFIDAAGSSETIALRGLNGVGLYDDLEKYNKELEVIKQAANGQKIGQWFCYIMGGISLIAGLYLGEYGTFNVVIGVLLIALGFFMNSRKQKSQY